MIAIFTAGGIALLVSGFGTPILMRWLTSRRIGQHVREDGPAAHVHKAGTPTMGGIAMIIASPVAWLIMHKWLQDFEYRTTIGWMVFAITFVSTALITLTTISFQAVRAATSNPVKSLKTE